MGQPRVHSAVPARSRPRWSKTVTRSRFGAPVRRAFPNLCSAPGGAENPKHECVWFGAHPPGAAPPATGPVWRGATQRAGSVARPREQARAYDQLTHVLEMASKGWRAPCPAGKGGAYGSRGDRPHRRAQLRGRGAPPLVRGAPPGGAGLLAPRGGGPPRRLLGHHPLRRLRARQPGLGAVLLGPPGLPLPRHGRRPAGPAAADDGQHGPDHAHALPPAGQQGLHPQDGRATWSSRSSATPTASSTPSASAARPTSSRRSPPSSPCSSSPSCWACPRRTAAWSSTGPTA